MTGLRIPYDQLSPEALHGVIEEFLTRDGTDYGEIEVSLENKLNQVLNHKYRLTPSAKSDLIEIWNYTVENRGEKQAEKYFPIE